MSIPDEAVEAAALAMFTQSWEREEWNTCIRQIKTRFLSDARLCLEAATPYLVAEAKQWCVTCDHSAYNPGLPATVPHAGGDDCAFEDDDWNAVDQ